MPGPGMPVVRRPHRKSRNGCASCKRKVKCDETKPICLNCTRHELQCEFKATPKPAFLGPGTMHGKNPVAFSPAISVTESYGSPQRLSPPIQLPPTPNEFHSQSLNIAHLELLYHYCTTTCHTLSWNPVLKNLYQTNVLKLGFTCDYVMRSILAISAIHLSRLKPDQKNYYISQAMDLHHLAVLEGSAELSNITSENYTHLYLFSTLTFIFELAQPRRVDASSLEEDTRGLLMLRGTRIVIESLNHDLLYDGSLGPMFEHGKRRAHIQTRSTAVDGVDHLWMLERVVNDTLNHHIYLRY